jgi:YbbR domain-containing protein
VLNLLKNNFGLKVLAVGLALAAWGYFHLAAAPGTLARFDQTLVVPIVVTGLKPGYQARYDDKTATVVVESPRNGPGPKPEQVQAVLDVSDLADPGKHAVAVKLNAPDIVVKSLAPASVYVTLDRIEDRTVRVSLDYVGDRRGIVIDSAQLDPTTTTIRGPSSVLSRVAGVRVQIEIPAKPKLLDEMVGPIPIDARGTAIDEIQVSPNLVRARVKFIPATTSRTK